MKKKQNLPETPGEIAGYFTPHQLAAWKKKAEDKLETYLFVMSRRHRCVAWCSHCHHIVHLNASRHRRLTACPHCGSVGEQIHAWRGYSRLHDSILAYDYAYSRKEGGALVAVSIYATVWWHRETADRKRGIRKLVMPWRIQPTVLLDSVSVFRYGEGGVMACPYRGHRAEAGCTLESVMLPHGRGNNYCSMGVSTLRSIYTDEVSFHRAVKRTPFHYVLDALAGRERFALDTDGALKLLDKIARYPFATECLAKMGKPLHNFLFLGVYDRTSDKKIIDWQGRTLREVLRGTLTKEEKAWMREEKEQSYVSPDMLEAWQGLRKSGNQQTLLPDMVATGYDKRLYHTLPNIAPARIMHYLRKQGIRQCYVYADYISMCKEEGVDLTSKANLFPRDIRRAHDAMVDHRQTRWELERLERERKMAQEKDSDWDKRREAIAERYSFAAGGIVIRVPEKMEELIDEGNAMHNCVGTYIRRVAEGATIVVFIRAEATDERLGTMEIASDGTRIIQARAKFNGKLAPEVKTFVDKFEAEKIKPFPGIAG